MTAKGLAKLLEECGELSQVAAKKVAYYYTNEHPDGGPPLSTRLEEEMGDVIAAIEFVASKFELDWNKIIERKQRKCALFLTWDMDRFNNTQAIDRDSDMDSHSSR